MLPCNLVDVDLLSYFSPVTSIPMLSCQHLSDLDFVNALTFICHLANNQNNFDQTLISESHLANNIIIDNDDLTVILLITSSLIMMISLSSCQLSTKPLYHFG